MIQSVLFDIDGVLLSEERCFDASALAVWELLHSPKYLGIESKVFTPTPSEQMIREIRAAVFCDDKVLSALKSRGLNSNWDMVFLAFSAQLVNLISQLENDKRSVASEILGDTLNQEQLKWLSQFLPDKVQIDYVSFINDLQTIDIHKEDITASLIPLVKRKLGHETESDLAFNSLWELGREVFQEWYVGDAFIQASIGRKARQGGKKGFLQEEIPLAPVQKLNDVFQWIFDSGKKLGIGTGRPEVETMEPLRAMGLLQWVEANHIVTSDDVLNAQDMLPDVGALGKPHPYTYLQSYFGKEKSVEDILGLKLPLPEGDSILIVGDSVADFYAARSMGARFAAVLTGLTGEKARSEFERLGATYILNDVTELIPLLSELEPNGVNGHKYFK